MTVSDTFSSTPYAPGGTPKPKRPPARRDYTVDLKLKIVRETLVPGASVSVVARRHNVNSNVVFRWRKEFREGKLGENAGPDKKTLPSVFVPVRVVPDAPALPAPGPRTKPCVMAITLPGGFTLRVDADIDDAALRRVLQAVRDLG